MEFVFAQNHNDISAYIRANVSIVVLLILYFINILLMGNEFHTLQDGSIGL